MTCSQSGSRARLSDVRYVSSRGCLSIRDITAAKDDACVMAVPPKAFTFAVIFSIYL